jgi:hypothetical protein
MPLHLEFLEDRCNPSAPTLAASITLPGANSAWNFGNAPLNASPIVYDLFGTGQTDVITPGGDGNLYAYGFNKSTGQYQQLVTYSTGGLGAGVPIQSTPCITTLPTGLALFVVNSKGSVFGWDAKTGALLPGWPQSTFWAGNPGDQQPNPPATLDGVFGSIAAGDLENNGNPDIVCASTNHEVTAFHSNGTVFWRYNDDDTIFSGVAIGDINRTGRLSVVVGGDSSNNGQTPPFWYWAGGKIIALSWEGHREWVVQTNQVIWSTPVLADLQGNGYLDVVVGTGIFFPGANGTGFLGNEVYAVDPNGNILPGWPVATSGSVDSGVAPVMAPPAVGDLLGNGQLDVVVAAYSGALLAIAPNGQIIWQVSAFTSSGGQQLSAPIIGPDITGDGHPDVFLGSDGAIQDQVLEAFDGGTGATVFTYSGEPQQTPPVPAEPQFNAAVVGHFQGDSTYELAVVENAETAAGVLAPSFLQVFNLGTSNVAPPWPQLRSQASGDGVARSAKFSAGFVTTLYQTALGRTPSAGELASWVTVYANAPTIEPFVGAIVSSQEARADLVTYWYALYLGRGPDAAGLNNWLNFIAAGNTYATVKALFLASPESFNDGGGTNPGWVTYLYEKILGRDPSPAEVNSWVSLLDSGARTRDQVSTGFYLSPECTDGLIDFYYAYFQPGGITRPPIDDLQAMGMDMRAGAREEQVLTQMLTANGDYLSVQGQGSWLRAVYQDLLGRPITPAEAANWLTAMEQGVSMSAVATAVINSPEALNQLISTPQYPPGQLGNSTPGSLREGDLQGVYQHYLKRAPSAAEQNNALAALQSGQTVDQLVRNMVSTQEYFNLNGGTAAGFVNAAYNDILGRAPNSAELAKWVADANVQNDLPQTLLFGAPQEYYTQEINNWFNAYLHRFPNTPSDLSRVVTGTTFGGQAFLDAMVAGGTPNTMRVIMLTSAEYQNIALFKEFWLGGGRWLS